MASFKILSIVFEVVADDGTTEEREVVNEGRISFLEGADHNAKFWFATDLPDAANSTNVVAGCRTLDAHFEEGVTRNHRNTMAGIIDDGNHDLVICAYTTPGFGLAK